MLGCEGGKVESLGADGDEGLAPDDTQQDRGDQADGVDARIAGLHLAAGLGLADQALLLCGLDQAAAARVITELRGRLNPALIAGAGV